MVTADDADLVGTDPVDAVLGSAFQRSVLAMFVVDLDLIIVRANPAASSLIGVDDLAGRQYTDFHTPDSARPCFAKSTNADHITHFFQPNWRTENGR